MSNLLPCPFCGATDNEDNATQQAGVVLTQFKSPIGRPAHRVECQCGASGAAHLGAIGAIELWNRRHPAPSKPKQQVTTL